METRHNATAAPAQAPAWALAMRRLSTWISRDFGGGPRPAWRRLRERIGENVLRHGWNKQVGAYTVAYGFTEMDAASLWIGLSGLLPDDDPRFLATVLATEAVASAKPDGLTLLAMDEFAIHKGHRYATVVICRRCTSETRPRAAASRSALGTSASMSWVVRLTTGSAISPSAAAPAQDDLVRVELSKNSV